MHLNLLGSLSLAVFAAATLDIKAESAGAIAADLGLASFAEQLADKVEHTGVGSGIGAGGSADGALVDANDFINTV